MRLKVGADVNAEFFRYLTGGRTDQARVVDGALRKTPRDADAWSVRRMAEAEKMSKSTTQRWFSLFGVKPHRGKTSKPSRSSSRQSGM